MTPALEERYKDYVRGGGNLVLTMRAGVKDDSNICRMEAPLPGGGLIELAGVEVHEYDCLRDVTGSVIWNGISYSAEKWSDIISLVGAEPLAVYDFEFYAGSPAITVNSYGDGLAYYVGTELGPELAMRLVDEFISKMELGSLGDTPKDVEIAHRKGNGKDYIFMINHSGGMKTVSIPDNWKPYFDGQSEKLKPYSVDVYTVE
jgi:beta-galactosidase